MSIQILRTCCLLLVSCTAHLPFRPDARVAIIGAGPSGVHMATLLKHRANVTLFEANDRVGGKSFTRIVEDHPVDLGTAFLFNGEYNTVYSLVRKYDLSVRAVDETFVDGRYDDVSDDVDEVSMLDVMRLLSRYTRLYKKLAPLGERSLFEHGASSPGWSTLSRPWIDVAMEEGLEGLTLLVQQIHGDNGYLTTSAVPLWYVMVYLPPRMIWSGQVAGGLRGNRIVRTLFPKVSGLHVIETGFQSLWERMVRVECLDVRYRSKVTRVERPPAPAPIKVWVGDTPHEFDFVVFTGIASSALDLLGYDATVEERSLYEPQRSTLSAFVGTLYSSPETKDVWDDTMVYRASERPGAWINDFGTHMGSSERPRTGHRVRYALQHYDFARNVSSCERPNGFPATNANPDAERVLRSELRQVAGVQDVDVLTQYSWCKYFPHWTAEHLQAAAPQKAWRRNVAALNRTWFIGSSQTLDSVSNVVDYNKLLLSVLDQ